MIPPDLNNSPILLGILAAALWTTLAATHLTPHIRYRKALTAMTKNHKLTTGQVADLFGVHPNTVRGWADDGLLPCTRTLGRGHPGERRFDPTDIQKLITGDHQ